MPSLLRPARMQLGYKTAVAGVRIVAQSHVVTTY